MPRAIESKLYDATNERRRDRKAPGADVSSSAVAQARGLRKLTARDIKACMVVNGDGGGQWWRRWVVAPAAGGGEGQEIGCECLRARLRHTINPQPSQTLPLLRAAATSPNRHSMLLWVRDSMGAGHWQLVQGEEGSSASTTDTATRAHPAQTPHELQPQQSVNTATPRQSRR